MANATRKYRTATQIFFWPQVFVQACPAVVIPTAFKAHTLYHDSTGNLSSWPAANFGLEFRSPVKPLAPTERASLYVEDGRPPQCLCPY